MLFDIDVISGINLINDIKIIYFRNNKIFVKIFKRKVII